MQSAARLNGPPANASGNPASAVTDRPPETQLVGQDLTFGYERGRPIIDRLSARLQGGQLCALIGPNAAGKSTLLKLLIGQQKPWDGTVTLDGQDVVRLPAYQRARRISYVPQRTTSSFAFTVREVIAMGRYALTPDQEAVDGAIQACDLAALPDRVYARLSVGQQQRVLIARALAQATGTGRVMLMDEPGSAMDLWHVHQMMQTLASLARKGLGILVVLHDLNLAARYANHIWLMDRGRMTAAGPWQTVLQREIIEPVYRIRLQTVSRPHHDRPVFCFEPPNVPRGTL